MTWNCNDFHNVTAQMKTITHSNPIFYRAAAWPARQDAGGICGSVWHGWQDTPAAAEDGAHVWWREDAVLPSQPGPRRHCALCCETGQYTLNLTSLERFSSVSHQESLIRSWWDVVVKYVIK